MPEQRTGIFLCYRRQDSEDFTSRIFDELARHFGRDHIFKDVDSLLPGLDWQEHLDARLAQAAVAIVIIGEEWVDCRDAEGQRRLDSADDHVGHEISRVLGEKIPVIPLLVGATHMPKSAQLPEAIRGLVRRQNFAVRRDQHFRNDVRLLIENLERLPGLAAPVESATKDAASPPSPAPVAKPSPSAMPAPDAAPRAAQNAAVSEPEKAAPPWPQTAAASPPARVHQVLHAVAPPPIASTTTSAGPPSRRRLHPLPFFFGWAFSVFLLPIPWLGPWMQQRLLRAHGLPSSGWLAQTGWAAPAAFLVTCLVALHLGGSFGEPRLRTWGSLGTSWDGWETRSHVSVPVAKDGSTPALEADTRLVIDPEFSTEHSDFFWFGVLAGAPLLALLGLQWKLLRPVLRVSWLWFLPVPALLWSMTMSYHSVFDAKGALLWTFGLHTVWQAVLLSLFGRRTSAAA